MENTFYPIGCDHKKANGLSAWSFQHESSGNVGQTETVYVCLKCGDFRVAGHPAEGTRYFKYEGHIIIKREFAAMLRQAAFFNEQSIDDFMNDLKTELQILQEVWPDRTPARGVVKNFAHEPTKEPQTKALNKHNVSGSADLEDDFYDEEYMENQPHEDCPKCGRTYDDIDFDYQSCSKCGWDVDKNSFSSATREPSDDDYMNGDADLLTGQWI